jgi:hypothetical protein
VLSSIDSMLWSGLLWSGRLWSGLLWSCLLWSCTVVRNDSPIRRAASG